MSHENKSEEIHGKVNNEPAPECLHVSTQLRNKSSVICCFFLAWTEFQTVNARPIIYDFRASWLSLLRDKKQAVTVSGQAW